MDEKRVSTRFTEVNRYFSLITLPVIVMFLWLVFSPDLRIADSDNRVTNQLNSWDYKITSRAATPAEVFLLRFGALAMVGLVLYSSTLLHNVYYQKNEIRAVRFSTKLVIPMHRVMSVQSSWFWKTGRIEYVDSSGVWRTIRFQPSTSFDLEALQRIVNQTPPTYKHVNSKENTDSD
jgi:hypothetical protein